MEEYTLVTTFVLHCMTDYSQSLLVLELLQEMAEESSDDTFIYAVNRLVKQYDTELGGIIYKAINEMLIPAVTDIAQAYNKFYYEHRVLDAEPAVSAARVALTKAVKDVIKTGLWLIGIEAPERM